MDPNLIQTLSAAAILIGGYLVMRAWQHHGKERRAGSGASLTAYTTDLTVLAREKRLDPVAGRAAEIDRVIHILMRRTKNNPLLVGEPGVGKSAIVTALAQRIVAGDVPHALADDRVLELRIHDLMAGTKYRGEFEERIRAIVHQLEAEPRKVVLFIDEVHLLEAAGRSEGALSITDVLKPGLASGKYQLIGATTWGEYLQYIQPNEALDRRLQPVLVHEPSRADAEAMLRTLAPKFAEFHGVTITDAAITSAVALADEKIDTRYLPDSAIDLIDEASAKVAIEAERAHAVPLGVVHAAASQKRAGNTADRTVDVADIAAVVDQWVAHSREEAARDPRRAKSAMNNAASRH